MVASDPRGHLLQTWAWGELKRAFGWKVVRLALERDGQLTAGAQVLYRRFGPFSLGYIPKGPAWVGDAPEDQARLWQAVETCSRRLGAVALKVEPEWYATEAGSCPQTLPPGMRLSEECIQPRHTIMVDLRGSQEEILARMKPKWRYNIRLSERKGLVVREGEPDDAGAFHALLQVTGQRDAFAVHSLEYYRQAVELFAPLGRVRLLFAYLGSMRLAGLVVYAFNGMAWYMYGASANEHRELMPNHQLQWRAMQWAQEKGCRRYDLWGIAEPQLAGVASTPLAGVQRFKEGFGGEVVRYLGAYDQVYLPSLYWLLRRAWAQRRRRSAAP